MSNPLGQQDTDTPVWMADFLHDLGQRLRAARQAQGLSLRAAAPRCGVSYQMLAQIEAGTPTTTEKLAAIAQGLGVEIDVRVGGGASGPDVRVGDPVVDRFATIVRRLPQEDLEVFLHELALWERRYGAQQ